MLFTGLLKFHGNFVGTSFGQQLNLPSDNSTQPDSAFDQLNALYDRLFIAQGYNANLPPVVPSSPDGPLKILLGPTLRGIMDVNEAAETITVRMYSRLVSLSLI